MKNCISSIKRILSPVRSLQQGRDDNRRGFSLVELIIVIVIIALLSGAAYVGIQKVRSQGMNDKVLDDLIAIANAMEQYKQDNNGDYPLPTKGGSMNMNCYYADATYSHDCDEGVAAFVQGMIDNNLLTKRYLQEVPTDPRTGSRYVYGVSTDKQYFQIAGNYEEGSGYIAKTVGNLAKGYKLPSVIRAFNGPNFVVENGSNLPYSPDHMVISGKLNNVNLGTGSITIDNVDITTITEELIVETGNTIETTGDAKVDIYFSDGSVTHLDGNTKLEIQEGTKVEENDEDGIITKIRLKLFSGKIWNKVARLAQNSEFNIETTSAIAGVRGTEFGLEIDEIDPTGAGDRLLLYSGDVCRLNFPPVDSVIPAQDIKNCTGSHKIANMTVDPGDPLLQGMLDLEGFILPIGSNPDLEDLMEEQTKHYLNDNMRPHILSIESGVVTIQNIKSYYDVEHDIVMDYIVVYANGVSMPLYTGFTLDPEDNYLISLTSGTNVTFRFEDDEDRKSGFSQPPITITATTALTEADLYGVEVEEEEICEIILNSPVMTTSTMTFDWSLTEECPDGMYTIDVDCEGAMANGESDTLQYLLAISEFSTSPVDGTTECSWSVASVVDASISMSEIFMYNTGAPTCTIINTNNVNFVVTGNEVTFENLDDSLEAGCFDTTTLFTIDVGGVTGTTATNQTSLTITGLTGGLNSWTLASTSPDIGPASATSTICAGIPSINFEDIEVTDNVGYPIFNWSDAISPACAFDSTQYTLTVDGTSPFTSPADGITSFTWPDLVIPGSHTFNITTTNPGTGPTGKTFNIAGCGDGTIDWPSEICDGAILGGETCATQNGIGWTGTLVCGGDCNSFDTTLCVPPAPVITDLDINCTTDCMSGSMVHSVTFNVTGATFCSADVILDSGTGLVGFIVDDPISFTGFDYNTGAESDAGDTVIITVNCDNGVGGTDSDSISVYLTF